MKVVVDTNVVVSAIIRDRLPEKIILSIVSHSDIEWIVSRKILHEYRKVLSRPKFGIGRDILEKWSAVFDEATVLIEVPVGITFQRDRVKSMRLLESLSFSLLPPCLCASVVAFNRSSRLPSLPVR